MYTRCSKIIPDTKYVANYLQYRIVIIFEKKPRLLDLVTFELSCEWNGTKVNSSQVTPYNTLSVVLFNSCRSAAVVAPASCPYYWGLLSCRWAARACSLDNRRKYWVCPGPVAFEPPRRTWCPSRTCTRASDRPDRRSHTFLELYSRFRSSPPWTIRRHSRSPRVSNRRPSLPCSGVLPAKDEGNLLKVETYVWFTAARSSYAVAGKKPSGSESRVAARTASTFQKVKLVEIAFISCKPSKAPRSALRWIFHFIKK